MKVQEYLCSGRLLDNGVVTYDYTLITLFGIGMLGTALAYFLLPHKINIIRKHRKDIRGNVNTMFLLFIAFILSCGIGHIIDFLNIFYHHYYFAAYWHIQTFVISIVTVFFIFKKKTYFLNLPSRSRMEKYVEASELIQSFSHSGIWFYDIKTKEVEWNKGMRAIYDKTEDWIVDLEEIDAMVMPESRASYEANTKEHRQGNSTKTFTYKIDTGKNVKHLEARILPKIIKGKVVSIFGSVQDITARIREEKEKEIFINSLRINIAKQQSKASFESLISKFEDNINYG